MIDVTQNEDGSFNIDWDETDPKESILNTYTKEDFKALIKNYLEQNQTTTKGKNTAVLKPKPINPNITTATEKDKEEFWYNSESEGKETRV